MISFLSIFIIFLIYCIAGYINEIVIFAVFKRRFVNRGFLIGPWLPVFGLGALLMVWLLSVYIEDYTAVFCLGMLLTGSLEYFTSYVLEKIFHNRWWDYSYRIDHINGRICLGNVVMFGFAAVLVVCFANPFLVNFLDKVPNLIIYIVGLPLLVLFIIDCVYSSIIAYELRHTIIVVENLKNGKIKKLEQTIEDQIKERFKKIKINPMRLIKAFPSMIKINEVKIIKETLHKITKSLKLEKKTTTNKNNKK